jgi:hypothetical protein
MKIDMKTQCCKAGCHRPAEWIMGGDGGTFELCDRHAQEAQVEHGYECIRNVKEGEFEQHHDGDHGRQ